MKCELCHKAEAEKAIRRSVEGEEQELYVCGSCAQEVAHEKKPSPAEVTGETPRPPSPEAGLPPLPLMGMILDAAFEIVGRTVNSQAEQTCPACGITRTEYRKSSRLGCPACYEAFAKELDAAVLEMHRSLQHAGKSPAKARAAWQRQQIEKALDDAVKGQRYEEAIDLRDQLRRLDHPETQGGPS